MKRSPGAIGWKIWPEPLEDLIARYGATRRRDRGEQHTGALAAEGPGRKRLAAAPDGEATECYQAQR